MSNNDIDKFGTFIVNGMMLTLLWAIIALPISSFSLVRLEPNEGSDVLSGQDERLIRDIEMDYAESENKSFRPPPIRDGTDSETYIYNY